MSESDIYRMIVAAEAVQAVDLEAAEVESMLARILREILRFEIEYLLPVGALAAAKVAEASERKHLARVAAMLERR